MKQSVDSVILNTDVCSVSLNELMPLIRDRLAEGQSVRFSPRGISMLPMLRHGMDTVTLSPVKSVLNKYDIPLYQREDGSYVLHRIVKVGNSYTCIGDNQFQAERDIKQDQIIAVVTSFSRNGKEYSVNDFGYWLYCRFWHYSRFPRRCWKSLKYRLSRLLGIK